MKQLIFRESLWLWYEGRQGWKLGDQLGGCYITQVRENGLSRVMNRHGRLDCGYILKAGLTRFTGGVNVKRGRKRGVKDISKVFGLSNWKNEIAFC